MADFDILHPRRPDGKFATKANANPDPSATLTDTPTGHLTGADVAHLSAHRGVLKDGYTPEDVTNVLRPVTGVELACVWDMNDDWGFGGDSEIVGRVNDESPWRPISNELASHLNGDGAPVDLSSIAVLNGEDNHWFNGQPLDAIVVEGANMAPELDIDACTECGAVIDADGYDGLCGACADKADTAGRWV